MATHSNAQEVTDHDRRRQTQTVMVTGATGYVGRLLIPLLKETGHTLRGLARSPGKLDPSERDGIEMREGDLLDISSLEAALEGVDVAYYLVHLMGGDEDFIARDRQAARNFAVAARRQGVRRIIYLGGLGDDRDPDLSPHLKSRQEVGRILRESEVEAIEFRAAVLVGAGSLSFEMIRNLTDRLPVMICPKWLSTKTQPIAINDTLAYLVQALDVPYTGSRIIEIGGTDVVTYGDMIKEYARQKKLNRVLIPVPLLTPWLSSLWLGLVTPATAGVGRHLIEGLQNPTVVRDPEPARQFSIQPIGMDEAIHAALQDEKSS